MTTEQKVSTKQQLGEMIIGYWVSEAIFAAAELGIADLLTKGPKTIEELAEQTESHSNALYRLMRALSSVGIFTENNDGRFSLTPLAENLVSGSPALQREMASMFCGEFYQAWGELLHSVQTGKGGFEKAFGVPIFEYLSRNPERGKVFDAAMTGIHGGETEPMLDAYNFSGFRTIVDVGAGNGSVLAAILNRHPEVKGVVFDFPEVVERTRANIDNLGLADRCSLEGGDFFEAVPDGGDAYMMRHIIHDWDDEKAVTILCNCRKAMAPGGKILVVENVIPTDNDSHFGKWLDLMMLLIGGKERTEDQYRKLFSDAGLQLRRIVPTSILAISVIEGIRLNV